MTTPNLWGVIPKPNDVRPPALILKEQAALLAEMTAGILEGRVSSRSQRGGSLGADLEIVAPALDGYSVTLITVTTNLLPYPAQLTDHVNEWSQDCVDEKAFVTALEHSLSSKDVKTVIGSLLTQSSAAGS